MKRILKNIIAGIGLLNSIFTPTRIFQRSRQFFSTLAAGRALYGERFNPQSTLKALCYFQDGNVHQLSEIVKSRLVKASSTTDLSCLPEISYSTCGNK